MSFESIPMDRNDVYRLLVSLKNTHTHTHNLKSQKTTHQGEGNPENTAQIHLGILSQEPYRWMEQNIKHCLSKAETSVMFWWPKLRNHSVVYCQDVTVFECMSLTHHFSALWNRRCHGPGRDFQKHAQPLGFHPCCYSWGALRALGLVTREIKSVNLSYKLKALRNQYHAKYYNLKIKNDNKIPMIGDFSRNHIQLS